MLLRAKEINKWIGARHLLKEISFNIYSGDKIGLVGRNGSGKSTLLKIISGKNEDFQGQINKKTGIGYLPQFYDYQSGQTVEEFLTEVSYDYSCFLYHMKKFDIDKNFLDRRIETCSGGEQTKIHLIRLLTEDPKLLILDEPTNHLDMKTRDWLTDFLGSFEAGVLLVSHDRHFLDQVVHEIWELEDGELKKYTGDYSDYRKQKEIELKRKWQEYEQYQTEKKRLKESMRKQQQFVKKADNGRKRTDSFWRQLKGADSRTGQMAKRVKSLQSQLELLDHKEKPFEHKKINPEFDHREIHSEFIIEGRGVSKRFKTNTVLDELDFKIKRESKIALIGKNGIGKSVLLKLVMGKIRPSSGQIYRSNALEIGYLSQKLANLHNEYTVFEEVREKVSDKSKELIRTYLGSMLFRGQEVFKKIKDLSIGERVRVAFTNLLLSNSNFLILDEPLNHLDITSRERIEEALEEYLGAFLVATHDRYFIKKSFNEIWELTDNDLVCYEGKYKNFKKYKSGGFKTDKGLKSDLVKMKKVELLAQLQQATDEEEIEKIEDKLDQL